MEKGLLMELRAKSARYRRRLNSLTAAGPAKAAKTAVACSVSELGA